MTSSREALAFQMASERIAEIRRKHGPELVLNSDGALNEIADPLRWGMYEFEHLIDLPSLSGLDRLKSLTLMSLKIRGISEVAKLLSLEKLIIEECPVNEIDCLSLLDNLETLCLSETQISDISPIKDLPNIKVLDLCSNGKIDISPISKFSKLEELYLRHTKIENIDVVSELNEITNIHIAETGIDEFSWLFNLNKIQKICIDDEQIESVLDVISYDNVSFDLIVRKWDTLAIGINRAGLELFSRNRDPELLTRLTLQKSRS